MQGVPEIPNWTDKLSAWGQAGGAVFTAAAVIVALWLGYGDRKWRRADQLDQQAAQARLATISAEHVGDDDNPGVTFLVKLANDSAASLRDVVLVDLQSGGQRPRRSYDFASQTATNYMYIPTVVPPGEIYTLPVLFRDGKDEPVYLPGRYEVTLQFTDSAGLRWQRTDAHPPVRVFQGEAQRLGLRTPIVWPLSGGDKPHP